MLTNFDKMCSDLEKQELEVNFCKAINNKISFKILNNLCYSLQAPTGVASPTTYAQLLAIYLYQNDL